MHQVLEYHRYGFRIVAFLGANRSPQLRSGNHVRPQSEDAQPWPFLGALEDRIQGKFLFWA